MPLTKVSYSMIKGANVNVFDFGALGDGSDATAAIIAASASGANTVFFPPGNYTISSPLTIPTNQAWVGAGGQRATNLIKAFNGDLINMETLTRLEDINLTCQGSSYSGRGVYISSGFSQQIHKVRIHESQSISLEFALNAGGGACVTDLEARSIDTAVVPAIKFSDNTACPRFFNNIWLPGGLIDARGGGNGVSVNNFYIRTILTDANTVLLHVANGRIAHLSNTTYISGANCTYVGTAFSGPVVFDNAQGMVVTSCSFDGSFTEVPTTCQYNTILDQPQTYTPTWTQDSGVQPSLGDGTLVGRYARSGAVCFVTFNFTAGSTTTFGNSASGYRFSLPFRGQLSGAQRGIPFHIQIGSTSYSFWGNIGNDENSFTLSSNANLARLNYPAVWTSGSIIQSSFSYMVR